MQSQESQKIRGVVNFQQEISNCIFLPGGTHLLIPLVKLVSHGGNDGKWNGAPTGHRQQCSQPCQRCSQPAQRCSQPGGVLRVGSRMEMKRFGGEKRRFPMNNVQQKYGKHEFCYKLVKTRSKLWKGVMWICGEKVIWAWGTSWFSTRLDFLHQILQNSRSKKCLSNV